MFKKYDRVIRDSPVGGATEIKVGEVYVVTWATTENVQLKARSGLVCILRPIDLRHATPAETAIDAKSLTNAELFGLLATIWSRVERADENTDKFGWLTTQISRAELIGAELAAEIAGVLKCKNRTLRASRLDCVAYYNAELDHLAYPEDRVYTEQADQVIEG
jgi:hypothetical protein